MGSWDLLQQNQEKEKLMEMDELWFNGFGGYVMNMGAYYTTIENV